MEKIKIWCCWIVLLINLVGLTISLSCSTVTLPSNSSTPSSPVESKPGTSNNEGLPPIKTYKDLDLLIDKNPASIDNSQFPITPVEDLRTTALPPQVDMKKYSLSIEGLVNNPLNLSYDAVLKYPSVSEVVLLICPDTFVDNAEWTGVPLSTFLTEAGIKPEATQIAFHAMDGYSNRIDLKDALKDGVLIAYKVNGQILPADHGYPLRLVAKGLYGGNWVKWIDRITVEK
jgi:DMSO/TMAO reductase YedYZ molybdopterin-dependent catalytic subunit